MRRPLKRAVGITLIELSVTLSIAAILAVMAAPSFVDYIANSRLREAGHGLQADALFAQSEAIKRNGPVRLTVTATTVSVDDVSGLVPVNLRTREFSTSVAADALAIDFGSNGSPLPFGTAGATDFAHAVQTCSSEIRCPGLRIDGGGAVRLCPNKLDSCT